MREIGVVNSSLSVSDYRHWLATLARESQRSPCIATSGHGASKVRRAGRGKPVLICAYLGGTMARSCNAGRALTLACYLV